MARSVFGSNWHHKQSAAVTQGVMSSSQARLERFQKHLEASIDSLRGRTFAVKRSSGQIEHGWSLSEEAAYGDAYGEVKSGEVMCISPDGNTFRACDVLELIDLNRSQDRAVHAAAGTSEQSALQTSGAVDDEGPPPLPIQLTNKASLKTVVHSEAHGVDEEAASFSPTHLRPASTQRTPSMKLQSSAQTGIKSFDHFLNLTANNHDDSPSDPAHQDTNASMHDSLQIRYSNLLLKYNELSRQHAVTQSELQTMMSSSAVSTSAVLSDMYMDLDKGYEELEQSYKRELESQEILKARNRELERELQDTNDRFSAVRHDFRTQRSHVSDLEVRLHEESRYRQQFPALQQQLAQWKETCTATQKELGVANQTIDSLQEEVARNKQVSEDLTKQACF